MKKYLHLFLIVLVLALCGCAKTDSTPPVDTKPIPDYRVPSPMTRPDYTFEGTPTTEELRNTAVNAMRDLLTIQWTPAYNISYYNTAGRDKQFDYIAGTPYGGLLYSGAGSGLFQFFEYYNSETGLLNYPGTGELREPLDLDTSLQSFTI